MCHHEGYHTVHGGQIDGVEWTSREPGEELAYDLPWNVIGAFVAVVVAVGASLSLVIQLLR